MNEEFNLHELEIEMAKPEGKVKVVTRVIVYSGEENWITKTLSRSLSVGHHLLSKFGTITVYELPDVLVDVKYDFEGTRNYEAPV